MSRKPKPKPDLYGPDGEPLDRSKYVKKPEPAKAQPFAGVKLQNGDYTWTFTVDVDGNRTGSATSPTEKKALAAQGKKRTLAERVAADLISAGIDVGAEPVPELPQRPLDLTAYNDAMEQAIKTCPHHNLEDTIHSRGEYQCTDCGKYLSAEDIRRRRGPFGGWLR